VKRATVLAAVLATLAVAAPASAKIPAVNGGSVIGRNLPLKVFASLNPPVHEFGTAVTAKVAVVADRKWVAPANLRVKVHFDPYHPVGPPTETRTESGRFLQITWTWTLRCLTADCVPVRPRSQTTHIFHFGPANVEYLSPTGQVRYALNARFQRLEVVSELSPDVVKGIVNHTIEWQAPLTPVAAPRYGKSPALAFWLAVTLAVVLGAAGLGIGARWAWQFRPAKVADDLMLRGSSLERALGLFFWAREHDDETLQRKALERVADELPFDVHDLSETARALAWSREIPDEEDVQEISERAGIHRRNGEPKL
jgi:hypothetical protein